LFALGWEWRMHLMLTGSLLLWALAVAVWDLRQRRIPNLVVLPACLVGVAHMILSGRCLMGDPWGSGVWAGLFALTVTVPAYALGKLGAGDAKYLLAIGVLGGWATTRNTFVIAAALGVILSVVWWLIRRAAIDVDNPAPPTTRLFHAMTHSAGKSPGPLSLPFGTLLSIGFCAQLLKR
jgi:prepilin peptidase CpaA